MKKLSKDEKIIEIVNVSKVFSETVAVDNVSLYVRKGEFITFLGPSGCGKTTTLRMIAGFDLPSSGKILLNGKDITDLPPNKRPVNTVFQRYALFPHYNIYDNIAFGLKLKKTPVTYVNDAGESYTKLQKLTRKEIDEKVKNALAVVDLEGFEKRSVSTLSGGQQQRVAIARAIVNEPEILLLDEPLGALDLKMRKEMQIELKAMHKKLGITFIYVTHDQEEALTMSDTIVVMKDGCIQQIGTPTDIYNEPANAFVADFIGDSNILSGTMVQNLTVRFCNRNFACVDDFARNEKVDVVVRPEDIRMTDPENGMIQGKVIGVVFKGVHYEITVKVGKTELIIQSTESRTVGEIIGMNIAPDDIHIMKKEFSSNKYDGYITKKNTVVFGDGEFDCDLTQLYPASHMDEEGYLVTAAGEKLDLTDVDVTVEVGLGDIEISDNADEGGARGHIVSIIYKGDHYQLIVRTEENEEDYVFDTEDLWNENDYVSVKIPPEKIRLKLKEEAAVK
ncbi:ATP-binding cassette domain-containing protein [Candidatus Borkfalkia ceftriaxoniphila]|uniref:ATP-binding cassette domain-containing protein n=1 Tax=Candidatus Borkfalkia ceftriaxoniphila TaxID=2508949 RepID=A0A4Q2KA33_9FIRM|nr:ATP-binding cassette domain-containing protein [Candidatus Borkfalkia ceftriaxoniphila]RXZ58207.1 ATP-binding cassette domain-containing protein [Candidatus Borkfalkia ceftriaxoniphila]